MSSFQYLIGVAHHLGLRDGEDPACLPLDIIVPCAARLDFWLKGPMAMTMLVVTPQGWQESFIFLRAERASKLSVEQINAWLDDLQAQGVPLDIRKE